MDCIYKTKFKQKPPQRVAGAVSILMSSGQDTNRYNDDICEGAEARTRFQSLLRLGLPPVVSSSSYGGIARDFRSVHQVPLFNVAILHSPTMQN